MKRIATVLIGVIAGLCQSPASAADVEVNGYRFTLPRGFSLELAAGPPLVERPIAIDYDEQGRLYVAESSGSNDPVQQQLKQRPHSILRLTDEDGDGCYDKRTVFADRMMFPEGAMWLGGSLYVSAPPVIWKLTDTDDDGTADRREEWFDGQTLTGCANDLHGPYRGPDGWIYWCKGAFAEQTHQRPGRDPLVTRAAHIFRRRPEGGPVEAVMTGGMDNPVDVVFTPGGERIFTTTFLVHPGGGQRDGLIHAIYGGVYGKQHGVLDGHPRTGDLMPAMTHLGAAAPCGLECMQSTVWGEEYHGNLFATLFNMHKLTRHVLVPDGATFTTQDEDFLVCDSLDFHPTDVIEVADGSLLVVDTGGWYKLCCPTSQLRKPDVLGGIYRIRREGAQVQNDPRGQRLDWSRLDVDGLAERLTDDRFAVRRRATELLATHAAAAVEPVGRLAREGEHRRDRLAAVWTLARIDDETARAAVRQALSDPHPQVRQAAVHAVSVWRDGDARRRLIELLADGSAPNRRAAAAALGRIGSADAVPAILAASARAVDRATEHSLIYALIEINHADATSRGLVSENADVQRAALLALDQMESAGIQPQHVIGRLDSKDVKLRETATWIARRHIQWASDLAPYFQSRLATDPSLDPARDQLQQLLAAFAADGAVQQVMAAALGDRAIPARTKTLALRALDASDIQDMPLALEEPICELLADDDPETARTALMTTRGLKIPEKSASRFTEVLLMLASDEHRPATWRLQALSAVSGGLKSVDALTFQLLRSHVAADVAVHDRSLAADVLAHAQLNATQHAALAETIAGVGPLELERVLTTFRGSDDERLGLKLLDNLRRNPSAASLPRDQLAAHFASFGDAVQSGAKEFRAELDAAAERQHEQLDEMLNALSAGDVRRGQLVFNSEKAACSACHAIGYLGGQIGPDLTRIGGIRSRRDFLESLLFPSASFVRSYEPVIVVTTDGRSFNGLLHESSGSDVVITTAERKQIRIARDEIDQIEPGTVSVMPAGLEQQLTSQELADLLAFLEAAR